MQLDQGERAIFAYFNTEAQAFAAAAQLRTLGYPEVNIDTLPRTPRTEHVPRGLSKFDHYSGLSYIDEFNMMGGPETTRLGSNLREEANYPTDMAEGNRYLVTVVTEVANADRAREVLRSLGALT